MPQRRSFLLGGLFDDTHLDGLAVVSLFLALGGLDASSLSLLLKLGLTDFLLLHLVDGLNKDGLVLVEVTLGGEVEVMVDILGDLLGLTVFAKKSAEDSLAAHPEDLDRHTGASLTSSLTSAGVAASALGLEVSLAAGARVHLHLTSHDETILHKFADVLS